MASPQVILITGANTGIGLEAVRALLKSSQTYHVLLCGRSVQKAQDAVEQVKKENPQSSSAVTAFQLDITDDDSITKAFEEIKKSVGRVDALVNNAGASFDQTGGNTLAAIRETWNKTWDTNVTGTYIITHVFVPLLLKSPNPRLLFLTSGLSSLTNLRTGTPSVPANASPPAGWPKPPTGATPAYRSSKTGLNMMMLEWWRTLQNDGVKVWSISPGLLATGLGGNPEMLKKIGAKPPSIGGEFIRDVIEGKKDADQGTVIFSGGANQNW